VPRLRVEGVERPLEPLGLGPCGLQLLQPSLDVATQGADEPVIHTLRNVAVWHPVCHAPSVIRIATAGSTKVGVAENPDPH
jgi:hypothetical protein